MLAIGLSGLKTTRPSWRDRPLMKGARTKRSPKRRPDQPRYAEIAPGGNTEGDRVPIVAKCPGQRLGHDEEGQDIGSSTERASRMGTSALSQLEVLRRRRALNRKQVPLCETCHQKVHRGEYDGISMQDLAYDFSAALR